METYNIADYEGLREKVKEEYQGDPVTLNFISETYWLVQGNESLTDTLSAMEDQAEDPIEDIEYQAKEEGHSFLRIYNPDAA